VTPFTRLVRALARLCAGGSDGTFAIADLDEEHELLAARDGALRADMWYAAQVFRSIRAFLALRWDHPRPPQSPASRIGDGVLFDLRVAWRSYRRTPLFTSVIVLTIALGIGATTAIFSVVEGVVLRALPFREPDRLVAIGQAPLRMHDAGVGATSSQAGVEMIAHAGDLFEQSAAYAGTAPVLTGLGDPVRLTGAWVPAGFFSLLGARPLIGRAFAPDDDRPGNAAVAIVSYGFWSTRMGGDESAIGRPITLDGARVVVIGVMPPEFRFPDQVTIWRSMSGFPTASGPEPTWPQGAYRIVARLRPSITAARAERAMSTRYAILSRTLPDFAGWKARVAPLKDSLIGSVRRPLLIMLAAVGLVLLVACANVANLLLARAVAREREIALRAAIGAEPRRVVRLVLSESLMVAALGGLLGIVLAWAAVPMLLSHAGSELPGVAAIGVNVRVLFAATMLMVSTGIVFGSAPALHAVRTLPADALRAAGSVAPTTGWRRRSTDALTVVQIALTVILLVGAGLLASSFQRLMSVDMGFDPSRIVAAQVHLAKNRYPSAELRLGFAQRVLTRLSADPATRTAAVATGIPLSTGAVGTIDVDRRNLRDAVAVLTSVTDDYFGVFRLPLHRGRFFDPMPSPDDDAVIVNDAFARQFLPGIDPIGHTVSYYGGAFTGRIVGVVGDARQGGLASPAKPEIYDRLQRDPAGYLTIVARSTGDVSATSAALRHAIAEADPILPVDKLLTMRGYMAASVARQQFYATLLCVFAAVALVIAAAGIYAVVTYIVAERTRELGIRIALGAARTDILALVVSRGLVLTGVGTSIGIACAMGVTRVLRTMLFGVTPTDPMVLLVVVTALAAIAMIACCAPAAKALRVDPLAAVRSE
jgi:putative ABC transport system permease protein